MRLPLLCFSPAKSSILAFPHFLTRENMDITWHGKTCFTIKAGGANVVFNPGAKSMKADVIVSTMELDGEAKKVAGETKVVDWPGEYEIKDIAFVAGSIPDTESMYITLTAGNIRVCMIENSGKKLDEELIDRIGDVDVLLIGIDGEGMTPEKAHSVIEEIEPRCVIPMNYESPAESPASAVTAFLKLVGASSVEPIEKFSPKSRNELMQDKTEYIVLQPQ